MSKRIPSRSTIFAQQILKNSDKIFWNYQNSKFSYLQLSHRSQYYMNVNLKSQQLISKYFNVPQNYQILYLPQECAIPSIAFNLNKYVNNNAIYIVNDKMGQFAYKQALKSNTQALSVQKAQYRQVLSSKFTNSHYYTFYNYVSLQQGRINGQLDPLQGQILICNLNYCAHYSSVDINKHGIVFFQLGYGFGLVGLDVVIIRKDLINHHLNTCPDMMCYEKTFQTKSIINTPYTMVPFIVNQSIKYLLQKDLTQSSVKNHLKRIKQQYQQTFGEAKIIKTSSQGILIIKIHENISQQQVKQYGWKIKQGELVLILQQENQGKSSELYKLLQNILKK